MLQFQASDSYWAVLSGGFVSCPVKGGTNFWIIQIFSTSSAALASVHMVLFIMLSAVQGYLKLCSCTNSCIVTNKMKLWIRPLKRWLFSSTRLSYDSVYYVANSTKDRWWVFFKVSFCICKQILVVLHSKFHRNVFGFCKKIFSYSSLEFFVQFDLYV